MTDVEFIWYLAIVFLTVIVSGVVGHYFESDEFRRAVKRRFGRLIPA